MDKEELLKEKDYLEKVKKVLSLLIEESKKSIDYSRDNITEMKKFMWDNLSDFTDEERALAMYEVDKDVNITNKSIDRVSKLEKSVNNPYFGKVTFHNSEFDENEQVYIGMSSVQDDLDFYVFDWRAPISSLFYNFELGKAFYEAPIGKIDGEIISKLQFKIENGKMIRCFNSDINIDDDYLQEILANSSTDRMKNIVSTIQREQNEIIRNDNDKYLIVQGVAGSGKTSVALHRIAYLLYKDKNLSSRNVLIFSPTDVFSDYISNVLPELGEDNALTTTLSDFSKSFLKSIGSIESYTEFLERVYNSNYDKEIDYKLSDEYYFDIKNFISNYSSKIKFYNNILINDRKVDILELYNLFNVKYVNLPIKERLSEVSEKICNRFGISLKHKNKIIKIMIDNSNINMNILELYNEFLNKKKLKISNGKPKKINYEDIAGLLYINFEINGYPAYPYIRQVVIDEVQDYTLFQLELLKKMFKKASFTMLGDINQTINYYSKYSSLNNLAKIFPSARYIELSKTYRSSEEIINYTNNILHINNMCSIRRNNNIPVEKLEISSFELPNKIDETVNMMLNNGMKKIAIITKNAKGARIIFNKLNPDNDYQLIVKESNNVSNDIVIIPSYLSKGLEFDGVIVCNFSQDDYQENEENLYYVVCTRAQHQLAIYNEPKKLIRKQS